LETDTVLAAQYVAIAGVMGRGIPMTALEHFTTAPEDRISIVQKTAYAVGMLVNNLQAAALPAMVVILNLGLGMDPILVGMIGFVPRIFDALADLAMGHISDNTRTRWGRRRPYIFWGAIVAGLVFAAMWQLPAGHSQSFYFWTFLTASILYFVTYAVFATAFIALGFEMTPDYHERTRLQAFANTAGQLAWLGVPWFYAIMASNLFTDKVHGARFLALWVGGAICVLGVVPAFFCRERSASLPSGESVGEEGSDRSKGFWGECISFFKGIGSALGCRPFVKLCAATFLVFNGFQLGASFSLYVIIYYVFMGDDIKAGTLFGWFGTLTSLCTVGVIPLTAWVSTRIGKRKTFLVAISLSLIGYALKWIGYNPDHPYWLLIACPFVAFGTGSLFTLMGSMIADVCDFDELVSYQRREGIFGAIYWWMVKVGMALAGLLSGVMLKVSGFDVALASAQSERTLLLLRVFDVGIPLVTSAIAIWIIASYEISEARAHEIRQELEQRRGKLV
jgi:GPH family glycoside/pentoside/hexuronide:cation symporter